MERLYWLRVPSPWGSLRLLATEDGLCRIVLPGEAGVERWVGRYRSGSVLEEGSPLLAGTAQQLEEYFEGKRRSFDLPLVLYGTPFQKTVWQALLEIPYGETRSYQEVAAAIGRPQASRAVGAAIGANPVPIVIPCHRVVRSDGSLGGYGGGLFLKVALLQLEGCPVHLPVVESSCPSGSR
ncbi:MAG: methylated-DNA--[protein]-cysteine S-methyltransferase [Chloroflexia bacterium]